MTPDRRRPTGNPLRSRLIIYPIILVGLFLGAQYVKRRSSGPGPAGPSLAVTQPSQAWIRLSGKHDYHPLPAADAQRLRDALASATAVSDARVQDWKFTAYIVIDGARVRQHLDIYSTSGEGGPVAVRDGSTFYAGFDRPTVKAILDAARLQTPVVALPESPIAGGPVMRALTSPDPAPDAPVADTAAAASSP